MPAIRERYDALVNRESAYETLTRRAEAKASETRPEQRGEKGEAPEEQKSEWGKKIGEWLWGTKRRQGTVETMAKQAARTAGSQLGRQIIRGVLGGLMGGSRKR